MQSLLTFDSDALTIRPWADEVVDQLGFDPRSPYVERFWLGVLGPSTTWLMRRLAAGFDATPEGFELPLSETARALGLGDRGGRNSPFLRSLNRSIQFEMARVIGPSMLGVRRRLPPLSRRHLVRLDPVLQAEHQRFQERLYAAPQADAVARGRRGRQLALSLLELGEDREEAERQLLRWRYAPAQARDVAMWAWRRHCAALEAAQTAARLTDDTTTDDTTTDARLTDDSVGQGAESRTATADDTVGQSAVTVGQSAVTVGQSAVTVGQSAVTVGQSAVTVGQSAVTVGQSAVTVGQSAVTVGQSAVTVGQSAVTVGQSAEGGIGPDAPDDTPAPLPELARRTA